MSSTIKHGEWRFFGLPPGQALHPGRLRAVVHADACTAGRLASPVAPWGVFLMWDSPKIRHNYTQLVMTNIAIENDHL